ncbi:MAG TPA: SdpI family protein [Gemmatimonadaceae bacterium]|nr:SdpI family protein [Gemmatimonadaceae bacterium]
MRKWLPALFLAASVAFSIWAYPQLPERVVTHWGPNGEPDGWSGRAFAAWFIPLLGLGTWLLLRWVPSIDPRRANYEKFRPTYDLLVALIVGFVAAIHVVVLGVALGWPLSIERVVPVGIGLLFVVLGNLLPRARSNWFFGIRTPWTLSSERVWERTHRVGGYLFVAGGLALVVTALVLPKMGPTVLVAVVGVVSIGIAAYSYLLWRRERGGGTI